MRINSVTVVRRTPRICDSACWVSGEDVAVDAIAKLEQPARHAGFDRMQRVAGRTELKLYQHRPEVTLDRLPDHGTAAEGRVKS
ncbi:hypothetical protein MTX20_24025 [Bradyrhizobium sp. ISRA435]|nr:hypothetical protein MTX20_24025 [Bradyrhizobium sp. ISRA435]